MTATPPRTPLTPAVPLPDGYFDRLREQGPVLQVTLPDGSPAWLVTRYTDVQAAFTDPRLSIDNRHADGWRGFSLPGALNANLLNMDPPDHTRVRRFVSQVFTPHRVDALRPRIRQCAESLLDTIAAKPGSDLVAEYALPLATAVICDLLGVPAEDQAELWSLTDTMLATTTAPAEVGAAVERLNTLLTTMVASKRHAPGHDLTSALVAARDGGDCLAEDELTSLVFLVLFAGYENPSNHIGTAAVYLMTNRGLLADLRENADEGRWRSAVEELMRLLPPAPISIRRFAVEPTTIGGVTIPTGATVFLGIESANRDPAAFADPAVPRFDRSHNPHLSLGHGLHHCLGAPLARAEIEIALTALFARFPDLTLAVPVGQLVPRPSLRTCGYAKIPVAPGPIG